MCSVIQTEKVQELSRMPKPHVSVARNENTDWRELGHILTQVERDRYEKTEKHMKDGFRVVEQDA